MSLAEPVPNYLDGPRGTLTERIKGPLRVLAIVTVVLLVAFALLSTSDDLRKTASVRVQSVGTFEFDPDVIETQRPDVFAPGHHSIFDVLVRLNSTGELSMQWHYDEDLLTHVIDSIDGKPHWWYRAYYDGGWLESNNFRMDLYPYKESMFIEVYRTSPSLIETIHEAFREEVQRLEANNGTIVIPTVQISGPGLLHVFNDVVVTAHGLRNDTFRPGVITAIDVIISLGDQGVITYDLQWYEEIGNAEVKNYFVNAIDGNIAYARCGFVYEEGDKQLTFSNHIHIPSDYRVLTSPEYERWFWICI